LKPFFAGQKLIIETGILARRPAVHVTVRLGAYRRFGLRRYGWTFREGADYFPLSVAITKKNYMCGWKRIKGPVGLSVKAVRPDERFATSRLSDTG
jgi:polyribonucleotide nucleotidyltransferase